MKIKRLLFAASLLLIGTKALAVEAGVYEWNDFEQVFVRVGSEHVDPSYVLNHPFQIQVQGIGGNEVCEYFCETNRIIPRYENEKQPNVENFHLTESISHTNRVRREGRVEVVGIRPADPERFRAYQYFYVLDGDSSGGPGETMAAAPRSTTPLVFKTASAQGNHTCGTDEEIRIAAASAAAASVGPWDPIGTAYLVTFSPGHSQYFGKIEMAGSLRVAPLSECSSSP